MHNIAESHQGCQSRAIYVLVTRTHTMKRAKTKKRCYKKAKTQTPEELRNPEGFLVMTTFTSLLFLYRRVLTDHSFVRREEEEAAVLLPDPVFRIVVDLEQNWNRTAGPKRQFVGCNLSPIVEGKVAESDI